MRNGTTEQVKNLKNNISAYKRECGIIDNKTLCKRIGISPATYYRLMKSDELPSNEVLQKIGLSLNLMRDDLLLNLEETDYFENRKDLFLQWLGPNERDLDTNIFNKVSTHFRRYRLDQILAELEFHGYYIDMLPKGYEMKSPAIYNKNEEFMKLTKDVNVKFQFLEDRFEKVREARQGCSDFPVKHYVNTISVNWKKQEKQELIRYVNYLTYYKEYKEAKRYLLHQILSTGTIGKNNKPKPFPEIIVRIRKKNDAILQPSQEDKPQETINLDDQRYDYFKTVKELNMNQFLKYCDNYRKQLLLTFHIPEEK